MRRLRVLVAAAIAICGLSASSFAAFSSVSKSTITASIAFTDAGLVWIDAKLSSGSGITWNKSSIKIGTTKWLAASNYITLYSTITHATGGIQIYTNNKASDATTKYTGSGNPAGLVGVGATAADPLPMCWRIVDVSTNSLSIVQGTNNSLYSKELGGDIIKDGSHVGYPCFFWMSDYNTPANPDTDTAKFTNGADYVTVKDSAHGIHHAEDQEGSYKNWGDTASPDIIYLGANFANAVTPRTYNALIRLEAYTE